MSNRTVEQKILYDSGLSIGTHLVIFRRGARERRAIVEITARGVVYGVVKPTESAEIAAWDRIKGDMWCSRSGVICIYPAKNADFMKRFEGDPAAIINL